MLGTRGQAYTLEGLVAAVLIASSVILGLQAVDVAPWTGGPSDDTIESIRTQGNDLLSAASDNGTLTQSVTCLDGTAPNTDAFAPGRNASATVFGPMLDEALGSRYDYNVYLYYWDDRPKSGDPISSKLNTTNAAVYPASGAQRPENGVVTVSREIVLYDSMQVRNGSACSTGGATLKERYENNPDSVYVDDVYENSTLYNIVEVRLEIW